MKRFKFVVVVILGLALAAGGFLTLRNLQNATEEFVPVEQSYKPGEATNQVAGVSQDTPESGSGTPVRIEVVDANINIPVINGYYNANTQKWTLTKDSAQYAVMTPKPNASSGNTFIYGHNRSSVFARLTRIKTGSVVFLTTDNNKRYVYKMTRTFTTNPTDSGFLNYQGPPILTLQTCTGANFQNRTLFVFELVGVTNA